MNQDIKTNGKAKLATPVIIFIGGVSAVNLYNYGTDLLNLSCLVSVIGLAATVLYFLKIDLYKTLIYIWTFAQVIVIDKETVDTTTNLVYHTSIIDMTQVFSFNVGLDLGLQSGKLSMNINVLSIILMGLLKALPKKTIPPLTTIPD